MQSFLNFERIFQIFTYLCVLWFSLSVHEFAHGWVAKLKGDKTAEVMGRLTLNPFAHIDLIGTVVLPILSALNPTSFHLFGWAKPVPVDARYLKNPRKDMFWIAIAGPLSNVILAILGTLALALFLASYRGAVTGCIQNEALGCDQGQFEIFKIMRNFIMLNISLAVLNMIPVHPLDGGKVLARFLPARVAQRFEELEPQIGMALMFFAFLGGLSFLLSPPVYFFSGTLIDIADRLGQFVGGRS
jgi:Zn-dependent protease